MIDLDTFAERNRQELLLLIEKANAGDPEAQYAVGEFIYSGKGTPRNFGAAFCWYLKAAELGLAKAQYTVGDIYEKGCACFGQKQDMKKAAYWYRLAAEQGHTDAQIQTGKAYFDGKVVEKDYIRAARWLNQASKNGRRVHISDVAYCYENESDIFDEASRLDLLASDNDDAGAQYAIGDHYYQGNMVFQDYDEAARWFKLAANKGNAEAQCSLGELHHTGLGVGEDIKEAVRLYRLAAEQGLPRAQLRLGVCYYFGEGVEADMNEALRLWRLSENKEEELTRPWLDVHSDSLEVQGDFHAFLVDQHHLALTMHDAEALYKIGECYNLGKGVPQDTAEAIRWFGMAAKHGKLEAQELLGDHYAIESASSDRDNKKKFFARKAIQWYGMAAEQGLCNIQYKLANCYRKVGDFPKSVQLYLLLAEQGHAKAQFALGECYGGGYGVEINQLLADHWWRKSAYLGNTEAQYQLGLRFFFGREKVVDLEEGVYWFRMAADQGHVEAQFKLANCYYQGQGVGIDFVKAAHWFRMAADQGHVEAQIHLGIRYEEGEGVSQDYEEAIKWYTRPGVISNEFYRRKCRQWRNKGDSCSDYTESVYWWRLATMLGDVVSQYKMSLLSIEGKITEYGHEEAINHIKSIANKGFPPAQCFLGVCYYFGIGVQNDLKEAQRWWNLADVETEEAMKGFFVYDSENHDYVNNADYWLNCCYSSANGQSDRYDELVRLYHLASDPGNADANYKLGLVYCTYDSGVPDDDDEAIRRFRIAAVMGHVEAQYELGKRLLPNHEGLQWLIVAGNNGQIDAQAMLGDLYNVNIDAELTHYYAYSTDDYKGPCPPYLVQDETIAISWYKQAAEQGHVISQYYLAKLYHSGSRENRDYKEAVKWYEIASKNGYRDATFELAQLYHNGEGVIQSYPKAIELYKLAAEGSEKFQGVLNPIGNYYGIERIQYTLGRIYYDGLIAEKNYPEAARLFELAAEKGHTDAKYYIGLCYCYGDGVDKDQAIAVQWWLKAAEYEQGSSDYTSEGIRKSYGDYDPRSQVDEGSLDAKFMIGVCYYNGYGVEKDFSPAIGWWRQAAAKNICSPHTYGHEGLLKDMIGYDPRRSDKQGHADVRYLIGLCYYCDTKQDFSTAYYYFCIAKMSNPDLPSDLIRVCEQKLDPISQQKTQSLAAESFRTLSRRRREILCPEDEWEK